MSWRSVDVKIKNKTWGAMLRSSPSVVEFSVSFAAKVKVGDMIECDGVKYKATQVEDVAQRGETFLITCEGESGDQSETGGASDSSG